MIGAMTAIRKRTPDAEEIYGRALNPRMVSRIREFGQRDEWKGCSLTAVKMAENRSNDVTTPTADSHSNF
jgi:hypothetical protein